jgi:hypothetical protein
LPNDESVFGPIGWWGQWIMLGGGRLFDTVTHRFLRPFPQEDVVGVSADRLQLALSLETGPPGYAGNDLYVAPASGREPRLVSPYRCDNVACVAGTDGPDDLGPESVFQTSIYGHGDDDTIYATYWIHGGDGNDFIDARAGRGVVVYCGAGRDVALVNRTDHVAKDCERVIISR